MSTRTGFLSKSAFIKLGAQSIYLNHRDIQIGRGETIHDTAKVLSRYLDAIVIRTFSHDMLTDFASHAGIPVINGLSDLHHPCQALADLMTILDHTGRLKGIRVAYIGDGNNVANSLIEASALTGVHLVVACPKGYEPDKEVLKKAVRTGKAVLP